MSPFAEREPKSSPRVEIPTEYTWKEDVIILLCFAVMFYESWVFITSSLQIAEPIMSLIVLFLGAGWFMGSLTLFLMYWVEMGLGS